MASKTCRPFSKGNLSSKDTKIVDSPVHPPSSPLTDRIIPLLGYYADGEALRTVDEGVVEDLGLFVVSGRQLYHRQRLVRLSSINRPTEATIVGDFFNLRR